MDDALVRIEKALSAAEGYLADCRWSKEPENVTQFAELQVQYWRARRDYLRAKRAFAGSGRARVPDYPEH